MCKCLRVVFRGKFFCVCVWSCLVACHQLSRQLGAGTNIIHLQVRLDRACPDTVDVVRRALLQLGHEVRDPKRLNTSAAASVFKQ